jgi:ribonuclease BN (tRNA processing enzyme)
VREENQKLMNFFHGADILIHDCQYTKEEYFASRIGWGHSYFEHAIHSALEAGVKKIVLFHYDPPRTDQELFSLEKRCQEYMAKHSSLEIVLAREGMEIRL